MTPDDTARLRFRRLTHDDQGRLLEMFGDPGARRFYPRMAAMEHVAGWVDWNLRNYDEHGFGLWAIERLDSGAFVGDCGLTYQQVLGKPRLEIGYHVTVAERGQGFALEAGRAALAYGFNATADPSICSIVAPDNIASIRVASRLHRASEAYVNENDAARLLFTTAREDR